jgi:hypothetical protein
MGVNGCFGHVVFEPSPEIDLLSVPKVRHPSPVVSHHTLCLHSLVLGNSILRKNARAEFLLQMHSAQRQHRGMAKTSFIAWR